MQDSSLPGPGSPLPANQHTVHAPCVFLGFLFFLVGVRLVCVVSGLPLAESMIGTLESDYHWMYLPDYSTTPHCVAHAVNHKSCLLFSSLLFNFNFPPFHLSTFPDLLSFVVSLVQSPTDRHLPSRICCHLSILILSFLLPSTES